MPARQGDTGIVAAEPADQMVEFRGRFLHQEDVRPVPTGQCNDRFQLGADGVEQVPADDPGFSHPLCLPAARV